MPTPKGQASFRIRVSTEQHAALEQIADERNVPVVGLLRDAIASITGVPDTLNRYKRGSGVRRKT